MNTVVYDAGTWGFKITPNNHHKKLLMALQGRKCRMCWNIFSSKKLTIDHIIARTDGGTIDFMNKQLLCLPCHRRKTYFENKRRAYKVRKITPLEYVAIDNDMLAARILL